MAASVLSPSPKRRAEYCPRIILDRHWSGRTSPRNRIGIGAAVTRVTIAGKLIRFNTKLERSELCLLAQFSCRNLIGRDSRFDVDALSLLRMNARQKCCACPCVISRAVSKSASVHLGQAAQRQKMLRNYSRVL